MFSTAVVVWWVMRPRPRRPPLCSATARVSRPRRLSLGHPAAWTAAPPAGPVLPDLNPFHVPSVAHALQWLAGGLVAVGVSMLAIAIAAYLWWRTADRPALRFDGFPPRPLVIGGLTGCGLVGAGVVLGRPAGGIDLAPLLSLGRLEAMAAVVVMAGFAVVSALRPRLVRLSKSRYRRSW